MPVLASFVYPQGAKFALQRQQIPAYVIGYEPGAFAVQSGRYTILQEVVYGGYQVHLKLKEWIWEWDNRGFVLDEIWEDFFVRAPDGSIIPAGTVYVGWVFSSAWLMPWLQVTIPASGDHYYFQRFPAATRAYWCPPRDTLPATPIWDPVP